MNMLRKSLDAVTIADLEELIAAGASESGALEFIGTLPSRNDKGGASPADRSTEEDDRIGDYARDEILAEMIAFANAEGGTLILGLHETKDDPRRAAGLEPLADCEKLARGLLDAAADVVEPRFVGLDARALPAGDSGAGYVVLRVGKSPVGPHRLKTTREFYVRRGDRAAKMQAQEINDRMLDLARAASRIEEAFQERRAVAQSEFNWSCQRRPSKELPRLLLRGTAFPDTPVASERTISPKDVWWRGGEFTMTAGERPYACRYPASAFSASPLVGLKSLSRIDENSSLRRLLTSDGLVEFTLSIEPGERGLESQPRLYVGWAVGIVVGVIAQVQRLRAAMAWDAVEFGMELEIWSDRPLQLRWTDDIHAFSEPAVIDEAMPLRLSGYHIGRPEAFDQLLTHIVADLHGAWGIEFDDPCSVAWGELL